MSEQAAVVQLEDTKPVGLTSPDSVHTEVEAQAQQQESAGEDKENAAAEQVFMYLQVSLMSCSIEMLQHCLAHWCMAQACLSAICYVHLLCHVFIASVT